MPAFVHPLLLWGLAAVAVPVLIHLLMRRRPRPRPWAAMRWLAAAARAAERRWKLTNLLLLALRCLLLALLALAISRPSLGLAATGGGRLVLVVDRSASMGARGEEPGPLAEARTALARAAAAWDRVAVVAVDARAELLGEGDAAHAQTLLARLEAGALPGGLDQAGPGGGAAADACDPGSDVLLVSDFQQDRGEALMAALQGRCRRLGRWAVGRPAANALVTGIEALPDPVPGQGGELTVRTAGAVAGAALAVDDGPFLAVAAAGDGAVRVPVPPLAAGDHLLRLRIDDHGLAYDNLAEVPVRVRPPVPALAVRAQGDWLTAALASDANEVVCRAVEPVRLGAEPLPEGGAVALRAPAADGARLAAWVQGGGVLWAPLALLRRDAALRALADGVETDGEGPGGRYAAGERELDEVLGLAGRERAPRVRLPAGARVLLRAGEAPLVAALPCGRGWTVAELADLADDPALVARGTLPAWALRSVRRLTAAAAAPLQLAAGGPAPAALHLRRGARETSFKAGEPALLEPGCWRADADPVLVWPSREEGRTDAAPPPGAATSLEAALPGSGGRELALWILLAALAVALAEGLVGAWAGRAYGK